MFVLVSVDQYWFVLVCIDGCWRWMQDKNLSGCPVEELQCILGDVFPEALGSLIVCQQG